MTGLESAVLGLRQVLDSPRRGRTWRWLVRQRVQGVRDALSAEWARLGDAGLAAREHQLHRERAVLLGQLVVLGAAVLDEPDVEPVRERMLRLVHDLDRHRQRVSDLMYDTVALELGGSE